MTKLLHPIVSRDIPFFMRVVASGDRYGRNMELIHRAGSLISEIQDPLIEFYDRRFPMEEDPATGVNLGQFVSRYSLSELMRENAAGKTSFDLGLNLEGGIPNWSLDAGAMRSCHHALMAADVISPPEGKAAAWLLITTEPPLVGIDPHPAYAPQDPIDQPGLSPIGQWLEIYGAHDSLIEAEEEIAEDLEMRQQAVAEGDLSDEGPEDVAVPVFVTEDGAIEFIDLGSGEIFKRHEAKDIHEKGFGMQVPTFPMSDDGPCL